MKFAYEKKQTKKPTTTNKILQLYLQYRSWMVDSEIIKFVVNLHCQGHVQCECIYDM